MRDLLSKDSAQPILEGKFPTPNFEIEFWKAKAENLECVYDQVKEFPHTCTYMYTCVYVAVKTSK